MRRRCDHCLELIDAVGDHELKWVRFFWACKTPIPSDAIDASLERGLFWPKAPSDWCQPRPGARTYEVPDAY
jgi:hypothetical protein